MVEAADHRTSREQRLAQLASASERVVLPALLFGDYGHLADEIARLEAAPARALHLDIMDGHFVPNLTYGLPIIEAVRKLTDLPLDLHLMISNPAEYLERYEAAGGDLITIHREAVDDPGPLLEKLRSLGVKAGLAINPPTPVAAVEPYLALCDHVLVMSVMPGFGGQAFEPVALEKLRRLRELAGERLKLEVDGGVNAETISQCAAAGANYFVVGSGVFRTPDYAESIRTLTKLAESV